MTSLEPPPFVDRLHALSAISHRLEYSPVIKFEKGSSTKNHLKLLDLLALLLVTEPDGDVAATTLIRTSTTVEILYSKNRRCTAPEEAYFQFLLDTINKAKPNARSMSIARRDALNLVIANCSLKIKARLNKLVQRLKSLVIENIIKPPSDETTALLWSELEVLGFPNPARVPLENSIARWLRCIEKHPAKVLAGENTRTYLIAAYVLGYTKGTDAMFDDEILLRRIRKFGDYHGAVHKLVKAFVSIKPHHRTGGVQKREVPPQTPQRLTLTTDVLGIINAWAAYRKSAQLTVEQLTTAYPGLEASALTGTYPDNWIGGCELVPPVSVNSSVHAECTLLVHLLDTPNPPTNIELGCSKKACWMCEKYIGHLSANIIYSGRQGKVHTGWQFHPDTPIDMRNALEETIGHELDAVVDRGIRRRKSDSDDRALHSDSDRGLEGLGNTRANEQEEEREAPAFPESMFE